MRHRRAIAAILAVVTLVLLFSAACGVPEYTLDQFNQLKYGMSRTEVTGVLGSEGRELWTTRSGTDTWAVYLYENPDGSNVYLSFTNGKLGLKLQENLK